jgi:hypothetical protein
LLAAIRICSLVAAKMAMVAETESERVACPLLSRLLFGGAWGPVVCEWNVL